MKAHFGVDSRSKLIHAVVATPANVADSTVLPDLLHGRETRIWGDQAYRGQRVVIRLWAPRGVDEEGTHERLKAHLRDLVNPKIKEHRGRIVKNTGDGFLAEFVCVLDAVRCAVEVQRGMADREPEVREERRIRFRILRQQVTNSEIRNKE